MVDNEHHRPFKITKCNEQDRDWSSLPSGILSDISSRLFLVDYYSFANVCTSWGSAAPLSPEMPFLFLYKQNFCPKPFCKLVNLPSNVSNDVHMPILGGKVCIGSQYGWLMLVDNTVCVISLYNPFSRQEIKLPTHVRQVARLFPDEAVILSGSDFISKGFSFRKVVLSCAPTSTAPFPAAAALFDSGDFMYKPVGDCGWKLFRSRCFQDITIWSGMLVGIAPEGDVQKLDLDGPKPNFEYIGKEPQGDYPDLTYYKHLVNLNNDLLQVWWLIDPQTQRTMTVNIMQLDLQYRTWIPVDDLCGHSLFLGTSHSFSLSSQRIPGLKDNLIYFMDDMWKFDPSIDLMNWKRKIGVYNVRNGTYTIFPMPNTRLPPSTSAFWYVPPLSGGLQNLSC